ncbi:MAG: hypothetical protein U0746_09725 [Gemmataceae bacterium]
MKARVSFPFRPKSNAQLEPGQFFSFRLSNGRFACGRVLALPGPGRPGSRISFLVGLMDWSGDAPAAANDLAGRSVVEHGWAHVIILADYAAQIDGFRPLDVQGIVPDVGGAVTYGREVLRILANKRFGASPNPALQQTAASSVASRGRVSPGRRC